ncbi:NAD(P)/FAD-dependent oxidoreductase [Actinomadura decatromicini]|uniref:NAD(P)/FAD-dependent oxidoreductase n=1 Tax=Actinomadura decatromicini TaxID=2604572 RepID=A0A5D3FN20_9ACTN|nr:NAD(P)/FAD-dependent oxidoreductase [Actinomadura decatromicini]TYK49316.1 NAD(P)/FAD-dependent oxidoreductase [Actinomadura decatromicini]
MPSDHTSPSDRASAKHILIVGGGYVGMYTALRLQRKLRRELRRGEIVVTVVDPQSYMTYQPFLPEAAAGNLEPRHVVAPLRRVLRRCRILNGYVTGIDHASRSVRVRPAGAQSVGVPERDVPYDLLVVALGSISRTLPIPGLATCGIGFKTVEEAIFLRNHVLHQLDIAASNAGDEEVRRRALTFVFVGAGFAGIEAMAELEDMARDACRWYPTIDEREMRWMMVEATDRILPEVGPEMGRWTAEALRARGIEVRLETLLKSAEGRHIVLSDGEEFDAGTLVWSAGVKPHPVLKETDLPLDDKGRIKTTAELTVEGADGVYAAGDNAAVPDLSGTGEFTAPNAQHAVRQARRLGDNIVADLRGRPRKPYVHAYVGSVASLGLHKGVANVYGVKLRGLPAWLMHRTYHLSRMPTVNRKFRITMDWTLAIFFRREIVSLGEMEWPRQEFELAAGRQEDR